MEGRGGKGRGSYLSLGRGGKAREGKKRKEKERKRKEGKRREEKGREGDVKDSFGVSCIDFSVVLGVF